ncbi:MAG: hypothetical protein EZS28_042559, partial [Streblomastix strix]
MGIMEIEEERRKIKQQQQELKREQDRKKDTTLWKLKKTAAEIKAKKVFGEKKKHKSYFFEKDCDIDIESYLFDNSPTYNTPLDNAIEINLNRRYNLFKILNLALKSRQEEIVRQKKQQKKYPELFEGDEYYEYELEVEVEDGSLQLDMEEEEVEYQEWD